MERFWHEERVRARGLGFELNIVVCYIMNLRMKGVLICFVVGV